MVTRSVFVSLAPAVERRLHVPVASTSWRSFVSGWVVSKEDKGTADSAAHAVGDKIEKAGEKLRDAAKEGKEPDESNLRKQVRSAAESVGEATANAGDKIEHSVGEDDHTRLKKRNLEDKQVLSN